MALAVEDQALVRRMEDWLTEFAGPDTLHDRYYEGLQRLQHLGLAVPPELRRFEMVVNWIRTYIDAINDRLSLRFFYHLGNKVAVESLREGWDYNNLDSQSSLHHKETMILGRGFVSVGANEEDPEHPLIRVESAREMSVDIDQRHQRIRSALRLYGDDGNTGQPKYGTLYLPNSTRWLERGPGGWVEVDRDEHNLGRVPIVMFLNRQRLGTWSGASEMSDLMPLVDAASRALTNLQVAAETIAIPKRWVVGMSKGDFVGADGKPIPVWESYMGAIWANGNPDAKVGQFEGADLKNFHETVNHYGHLASSVTGLPLRFFGQGSVNPASEGGIAADEVTLIKRVESKGDMFGDSWGWVMGLYERFRTGEWVNGTQIKAEWFSAATPTYAQRADALTKQYAGGSGVLSREGVWEEMGWSEARMERERERFENQAREGMFALEKAVDLEV